MTQCVRTLYKHEDISSDPITMVFFFFNVGLCCYDETRTNSNLGRKGFLFPYSLQHIIGRKLGQDLKQRPQRNVVSWFGPQGLAQPAFLCHPCPFAQEWHCPSGMSHINDLPTDNRTEAFS